jgi:septum formation protein
LIVLASRSPQRRAILEQLGIQFEVLPADVEERTAGSPEEVVTENALLKARYAAEVVGSERLVLSADTVVSLDGSIFGKAADSVEARSHLAALSGREHEVWSGLALTEHGHEQLGTARTAVRFRSLDERTIDWYLDTEEWRDRAGAYAIQGKGAALIQSIEGDYWNVVGLPGALLVEMAPQLLGQSRDG